MKNMNDGVKFIDVMKIRIAEAASDLLIKEANKGVEGFKPVFASEPKIPADLLK